MMWKNPPDRNGCPYVIGHRGAPAVAMENTRASIEAAAALGVDAVEVDLRITRDGHLVCFHDETTERLTGQSASVADIDLPDLRRLFPDILTFAEVVGTGPSLNVLIDVKVTRQDALRAVSEACSDAAYPDRFLLAIDTPERAEALTSPTVPISFAAFFSSNPTVASLQQLGIDWVRVTPAQDEAEQVASYGRADLNTIVVAGMGDPEFRRVTPDMLHHYSSLGYTAIVLDDPSAALDAYRTVDR